MGWRRAWSYSVSLAVALSSRPVARVGRIWADGKLLRGADGDFNVSTQFRFYPGTEDQEPDSFIASNEGLEKTPAYRGLALAVFEDLELAEFGNRIPFLTFEIFADEGPIIASDILRDASKGLVDCSAMHQLSGYAGYGRSLKAAIQPLVDSYAIDLFDDGAALVEPTAEHRDVSADELANSTDRRKVSRVQLEQNHARSLPSVVRLSFYDAALDYQVGEARAASAQRLGTEEQREFPGVITAAAAKSLAHQMIARAWAMRDKLTVRLPPRFLDLRPGSRIGLDGVVGEWTVAECTIDGFVMIAELRPSWKPAVSMVADAGRVVADKDAPIADVQLALVEVPGLIGDGGISPTVLLAASSASSNWRSCAVQIIVGTQSFAAQTASRKTILGHTETLLGAASPDTVDLVNSVDVHLIDEDQWLLSCDEGALAEGVNLAVLGGEVLQFAEVEPLGNGRFRLSHLLRGRSGTEWAIGTHQAGEVFAIVQRDALRAVDLPQWTIGSVVKASARNVGGALSESPEITIAGPQRDAIISPKGGDIVDDRARASIEQILTAMRQQGMIAS